MIKEYLVVTSGNDRFLLSECELKERIGRSIYATDSDDYFTHKAIYKEISIGTYKEVEPKFAKSKNGFTVSFILKISEGTNVYDRL